MHVFKSKKFQCYEFSGVLNSVSSIKSLTKLRYIRLLFASILCLLF